MGLTVFYHLKCKGGVDAACAKVLKLRQAALDLPFQNVGDLVDRKGEGANYHLEQNKSISWMLIQARDRERNCPPLHLLGFTCQVDEGCEPMNVGLCRYQGREGWQWRSFCKTQYAKNFMVAHLTVIALLDQARRLRILDSVMDEGDYWKKRDLKALGVEIGEWNNMIAAIAGKLKDHAEVTGATIEAPILQRPDFERLEAMGQKQLPEFMNLLKGK
jgi:hypothetical protein